MALCLCVGVGGGRGGGKHKRQNQLYPIDSTSTLPFTAHTHPSYLSPNSNASASPPPSMGVTATLPSSPPLASHSDDEPDAPPTRTTLARVAWGLCGCLVGRGRADRHVINIDAFYVWILHDR